MLITRISKLTGIKRTKDMPVTVGQLVLYRSGALIQDVFPDLSRSEREFLLTGVTDEEWEEMFIE